MAKRSNKTEHVLRLITKNDDAGQEDDFFSIDHDIYENGTSAVRKVVLTESELSVEEAGSKPDDQKEQEAEKAGKTAAVAPVKEQPSDEPPAADSLTAAAQQESPLVRAFREQENSQPPVPDQGDGLVNIAEILARERIALVMERMKVCTCGTCYNDVLALALNSLPTKYVTTSAGTQHFQHSAYKEQYETDILAALTKACVRVKASPRH